MEGQVEEVGKANVFTLTSILGIHGIRRRRLQSCGWSQKGYIRRQEERRACWMSSKKKAI